MQTRGNIELANIQQELVRLWETLEGTNKIRACLFNLIVYTCDEKRADYFQSLIRLVVDRLPCRILFVKGSHSKEKDNIRTTVSAELSGSGDAVIACELITIEASGQHLERVPFVIVPNIVPDLPVYLLWGGDPTSEDSNFMPLQSIATRLIFDSECLSDLPSFSRRLLAKQSEIRPEIADMNWARTRGWRDVISNVFHNQERISHLNDSSEIHIIYNQKETESFHHCHTQAVFLQGWIAAQLGWQLKSCELINDQLHFLYASKDREVNVLLKKGFVDCHSPGTPLELNVQTHGGHHFSLKRQPESKVVRISISSPESCELPYKMLLGRLTVDQSLMNEVLYENLGEHYPNMVRLLGSISCQLV